MRFPSIVAKDAFERAQFAPYLAEYLARGGKITRVERGRRGDCLPRGYHARAERGADRKAEVIHDFAHVRDWQAVADLALVPSADFS